MLKFPTVLTGKHFWKKLSVEQSFSRILTMNKATIIFIFETALILSYSLYKMVFYLKVNFLNRYFMHINGYATLN